MNRKPWTAEQLVTLRKRYPNTHAKKLVRVLDHPLPSIYWTASKLGLKKSAAFLRRELAAQGRRLRKEGAKHRFPRGHVPANKGLRRPHARDSIQEGAIPQEQGPRVLRARRAAHQRRRLHRHAHELRARRVRLGSPAPDPVARCAWPDPEGAHRRVQGPRSRQRLPRESRTDHAWRKLPAQLRSQLAGAAEAIDPAARRSQTHHQPEDTR